jgi:RHS repeat-associated protein
VLYDAAGRSENARFDFKGNLIASSRRFASDPRAVPDWSVADPDAALLAETWSSAATYDALDRISSRTTADGSVYQPSYNPANMLEQVRVTQGGATTVHVSNIDYDAKGQRQRIVYGNGVETTYAYDAETFRILRLTSRTGGGAPLQDLVYTYDPVGNATHIEDRAVPTVWFTNAMITALATYRYSPLYRLVEATGREHVAQVDFGATDNWTDGAFLARHSVSDPMTWRSYTQQLKYDEVGNITELKHVAAGGAWTRGYTYAPDSNRLVSTQVGASVFPYAHHAAHGFLTAMPHLTVMRWNFRDELQATSTQAVNGGTPETTWYVYDGNGKRVRKVTERQAAAGAAPAPKSERIYLDGVEVYREFDGGVLSLERRTFDVMDDRQCVARIETEGGVARVRYQGVDHLWSARVETDATGRVISYEEFHPFGTTAYQAVDKDIISAAKRYRFTGMERDAESGLEYHFARYYAPWLGRWTAPDKHADQLDGNRYAYVKNNPLVHRDSNGMFEEPTHGVLTYRLALAAGIPQADAARIAIATAAMDHDRNTSPVSFVDVLTFQGIGRVGQTEEFHFPNDPFRSSLQNIRDDTAAQARGERRADDLERFGRHLHTLEDVGFVDAPGPHMRHDPGRPVQRILAPTLGMVGLALSSGMLVASIHLFESDLGKGSKAVLGVLIFAVMGYGIYILAFALRADNIGHPSYHTERGTESTSFSHAADEAPSDPNANTEEARRLYAELKLYARARYGPGTRSDDAGAEAAIAEDIRADTSCLISNFANAEPFDVNGARAPSYSEILGSRRADQWTPQDIDATLPSGEWHYQGAPGRTAVCR